MKGSFSKAIYHRHELWIQPRRPQTNRRPPSPRSEGRALLRHGVVFDLPLIQIEKSFSKAIYHVLDNTGQLLPSCFSPRDMNVSLTKLRGVALTTRGHKVALNQSQAKSLYCQRVCFLHHRAFRVTFDSKKLWLGPWVIPTLSESCIRIHIALPYFGWVSRSCHMKLIGTPILSVS